MRRAFKGVLERALFSVGVNRLGRALRGSGSLVLAYHNVREVGEEVGGEASLHLSLADFAEQLDLLAETCEVVPLADLFEPMATDGARPRVSITFDDAYRGALRLAVPELRRRGLPATIFVAPGLLGGRTFWWDALLGGENASAPIREKALGEHRGETEAVRRWAETRGLAWRVQHPDGCSATRAELERAVGEGIAVASHSWSHPNLARLDVTECRVELERSRDWLEARFPAFVPWLSYPYGARSTDAAQVALECGYAGAYRISGGWMRGRGLDRFALPRLNVPAGLSVEGFGLRLAGLLCG